MDDLPVEDRVAILLNLLGDGVTESVLDQMPAEHRNQFQERLNELDASPPDGEVVDGVVGDFERFFRFAMDINGTVYDGSSSTDAAANEGEDRSAEEKVPFERSEDPIADRNRLEDYQLTEVLRTENPKTVAMLLNCLTPEMAGKTLAGLPDEIRTDAFAWLPKPTSVSKALLDRIVRVIVEKGCEIGRDDVAIDDGGTSDQKTAQVLRTMDRKQRAQLLNGLEQEDPDAAGRIKDNLYSFDDIRLITDASLQKLLREVELGTLAMALGNCRAEIVDKIKLNLPKRARDSLMEEMELSGSVDADEQEEARKSVVAEIARLDQAGQLVMTS